MKFLVSLFFIAVIGKVIYFLMKKDKKKAVITATVAVLMLLALLGYAMYKADHAPDTWCTTVHATNSYPPANLKTSTDYFEQGNYDYDTGNCKQAITDYTKSINLNSKYAQAYNNRAYTNMRLRNYKDALPDLDKAISLKSDYIQALMNRGDIHNYYYAIDKQSAIADYEKVIALGATAETSVCGHLFLAEHNGWTLKTFLDLPFRYSCK